MIMITAAEFERKMKKIAEIEDDENRHKKADDLLCKTLKSLGYEAGVEIYERIGKWYA